MWKTLNIVLLLIETLILLAITDKLPFLHIYFGAGLGDMFYFFLLLGIIVFHLFYVVLLYKKTKGLMVIFFIAVLLELLVLWPALGPYQNCGRGGNFQGIKIGKD